MPTITRNGWCTAVALAFSVCVVPSAPVLAGGGAYGNGGGYANGGYVNGDETYSTVVVSGADATKNANEFYSGFYYALNRDLDRDGFIIRMLGTRGFYEYDWLNLGFIENDGNYWQGDVMVGYQVIRGGLDIAGYIGVDYQDHNLTLPDPFNELQGSEVGFKTGFELESNGRDNSPWYVALRGTYSTAFDTYYAVGRLGHKFGKFTIGPEAWALGDVNGDAQRLGAFVAWDVSIGRGTIGNISLSAGHQFADDGGDTIFDSGRSFDEGLYGTVKFWLAFN